MLLGVARHQSTLTSRTGKILGSRLKSKHMLPSLHILPVRSHLGIQVRTLQTTTQLAVDGPLALPSDAKTAQVAELLASFRAQVEDASLSNSERRELAARQHLGIRAFEWMKQLEALDQQLAISKEFCQDLCWLLLAEGEEPTLVDFLFSEAASFKHLPQCEFQQMYHDKGVTGYRLHRNHQLLARLIEAHVSLSTDGTPNEALRCLAALSDAAEEKGIFHCLNWAGTSTYLQSYLTENHCALYDVKLLDALVKVIRKTTNPIACERNIAFLMLSHPTSPDPLRALKTIKNELEVRYAWKKGSRTVNNLGSTLFKTMFILELQGATDEALWARDTLKKEFGRVWRNRDLIVASLRKDPKLKHLLKKSSANVARDGDSRGVLGDLLVTRQKARPE